MRLEKDPSQAKYFETHCKELLTRSGLQCPSTTSFDDGGGIADDGRRRSRAINGMSLNLHIRKYELYLREIKQILISAQYN